MTTRSKAYAPVVTDLGLDPGHVDALRGACCEPSHWTHPPSIHSDNLNKFKSEVKGHYYSAQLRRCCYCSMELQPSKRTYELEHVLSRNEYVQFMFDLRNLAASCCLCNGSKHTKNVLNDALAGTQLEEVPVSSADYLIVHPHIDEWGDHLEFDEAGRIKGRDAKGKKTVDVCGIAKLNAIRVADSFGPRHRAEAEKMLTKYIKLKQARRRRELLGLLRELAANSGREVAIALVDRLEMDAGLGAAA